MKEITYYFNTYQDYKNERERIENYINLFTPNEPLMIVALNEAINNAFFHGNKENESKFVSLKINIINNRRLILRVKDEGTGFPLPILKAKGQCPEKDLIKRMTSESGRGLALMEFAADRVCFNQKGNEVMLMKEISKQIQKQISAKFTFSESSYHEEINRKSMAP